MKLRYRFFFVFSIVTIVPMLLFVYLAYHSYIRLSNRQITETSLNIVSEGVKETNKVFSEMQHILECVQYASPNEETISQELRKYTDKSKDIGEKEIYETNRLLKYTFQNQLSTLDAVNGIFIFTPSGVILGQGYGNGVDVRSDYDPTKDEWYGKTLELEGKIYIDGVKDREYLLNDTPSVSFSMCIYDVYSREFMGVLYINCAAEIFSLDNVNVLPSATRFYIDREGEILYQSQEDSQGTAKENQIFYERNLACEGVTLKAVFDKTELAADFRTTLSVMVGTFIFFFLLFVLLSYFLAKYLTRPISELSGIMAHPGESRQLVNSPYMNRSDEIGTLYNQYRTMLEKNKQYIKAEYENRLVLMDTQMKALESQINAHFLYNTLEAINSLAQIEGFKDISVMALALGDMFRYSIKTKGALVSLQEELTHVRNFVAISQIRFDNGFEFILDVPEELLACRILKLILQPLVENALYHGLLHCNAGSFIKLSARKKNGTLNFCVEDDGTGMSDTALEGLQRVIGEKPRFQELNKRENGSIGLRNINSRIKLYYGEKYGISIESSKGNGTKVILCIPEITEE